MTIFYVLFDASVSFCGSLNHGDGTRLRISSQEGSSRKGFLFCFVVMHVCFLLLVTLILPIECSFPIEKTHLFLLQFSSAWWFVEFPCFAKSGTLDVSGWMFDMKERKIDPLLVLYL